MTVTILVIIFTVLISFQGFNNRSFFEKLKHHPVSEYRNGEWYRMLSGGFLHADFIHLGINMYVLWIFGELTEDLYIAQYGEAVGRIVYLLIYLVMIVLASIPSLLKHKDNPYYGAIGASGAVSGVLFVYVLLAPWNKLYLYGILPIPAIIFGVLYLGYSSWAGKNQHDNIGHDAHFWGAVAGVVSTIILIPGVLSTFIDRLLVGPVF